MFRVKPFAVFVEGGLAEGLRLHGKNNLGREEVGGGNDLEWGHLGGRRILVSGSFRRHRQLRVEGKVAPALDGVVPTVEQEGFRCHREKQAATRRPFQPAAESQKDLNLGFRLKGHSVMESCPSQ